MGVHVVCKVFCIHQLFRREAGASTLGGFPLQNMDYMLLNLGGCVCVCVGGGRRGSYRGPEEEAEEKIKRGERGRDEKRGKNEIEGEGRKEKGWRVRRGEERSEGREKGRK